MSHILCFMLAYFQNMSHIVRMKRRIEESVIKKWSKSVGGSGKAARILMEAMEIAPTTADKLVRGHYPSEPQFLIRKALCELTGLTEDELFPIVGAKGRAS